MRSPGEIALLLAAALVLGCSGKSEGDGKPSPDPAAKKDAATAKRADATPNVPLPRLPDGFATTGVAACDEYVTKQRSCLEEHAPESIRKPQLLGLRAIAAKWAEAAKAGRSEQLGKTCTHMLASSKKATTSAWGCSW